MENQNPAPATAPAQASTPAPAPAPAEQQIADAATAGMVAGEADSPVMTHDKTQWLAIGLLSLAAISLILKIYMYRKQIQKLDKDDEEMKVTIKEVKSNVQKLMGNKYESLAE